MERTTFTIGLSSTFKVSLLGVKGGWGGGTISAFRIGSIALFSSGSVECASTVLSVHAVWVCILHDIACDAYV